MSDHKYLTINDIVKCEKYPFTLGQMRSFLLERDKNGLGVAVRKIGKRLYIRSDLFELWVDNQNEEVK